MLYDVYLLVRSEPQKFARKLLQLEKLVIEEGQDIEIFEKKNSNWKWIQDRDAFLDLFRSMHLFRGYFERKDGRSLFVHRIESDLFIIGDSVPKADYNKEYFFSLIKAFEVEKGFVIDEMPPPESTQEFDAQLGGYTVAQFVKNS